MPISFPTINAYHDPPGRWAEVGDVIARGLEAKRKREEEAQQRQALEQFLNTGQADPTMQVPSGMPLATLHEMVQQRTKPTDLSTILSFQKYQDEKVKNANQDAATSEQAGFGSALGNIGTLTEQTGLASPVKPGARQRIMQALTSARTSGLMSEGQPSVVTAAPQNALEEALKPVDRMESEQRLVGAQARLDEGLGQFAGQTGDGQGLVFNPRTNTIGKIAIPGGVVNPKVNQPLPPAAQENITAALDAWRSLNIMESANSESGIISGRFSQLGSYLGMNEKAQRFQASRNQFKLSAQALIKGIPSNFDVMTLIETLPDLAQDPTTNTARIENARASIRTLVQNVLAFYKGTGKIIPPEVLAQIKMFGIDEASVPPWNGQGDPLTNQPGGHSGGLTPEQEAEQYLRGQR